MNDKLQARIEALRLEFDKGKTRLNELQAEENQLQETMLRISGAITVLQELLVDDDGEPQNTPVNLVQRKQA